MERPVKNKVSAWWVYKSSLDLDILSTYPEAGQLNQTVHKH